MILGPYSPKQSQVIDETGSLPKDEETKRADRGYLRLRASFMVWCTPENHPSQRISELIFVLHDTEYYLEMPDNRSELDVKVARQGRLRLDIKI